MFVLPASARVAAPTELYPNVTVLGMSVSPFCVLRILSCSVLFYSVLFCAILFCSVLFYSILFYSVLFCSVLFCPALSCPVLSYPILSCPVLFNNDFSIVACYKIIDNHTVRASVACGTFNLFCYLTDAHSANHQLSRRSRLDIRIPRAVTNRC